MSSTNTTNRRGLLRIFAAAVPVATIASVPHAPSSPIIGWQNKPTSAWTHDDYLAEARHHVAGAAAERDAAPADTRRHHAAIIRLDWWERELDRLLSSPTAWKGAAA